MCNYAIIVSSTTTTITTSTVLNNQKTNLLQSQVVASHNVEHHPLGLLDGEVQQGRRYRRSGRLLGSEKDPYNTIQYIYLVPRLLTNLQMQYMQYIPASTGSPSDAHEGGTCRHTYRPALETVVWKYFIFYRFDCGKTKQNKQELILRVTLIDTVHTLHTGVAHNCPHVRKVHIDKT